ncbi:MAG: hypothetical protein K8S20_11905 [Chloroflexi bacterium]|nr:hypothetical protein [Chloroflexota bacterium]
MKTKALMIASSIWLAAAGLLALFAPEELLKLFSLPLTAPLPVLIQLAGTLYLSFALMNWTVKDNIIGGVYLRPISLANFAHFMMGALTLLNHQLSDGTRILLWVVLTVYAVFAGIFTWLVFFHTGIENKPKA